VFMACLEADNTPPELTDRDTVIRKDDEWRLAAAAYQKLKGQAEAAVALLDDAKEKLVRFASHPSEAGFGVSVTRFWKQGNVDYKRVPQLKDVDLDPFRGKGRFETRVTLAKAETAVR
jgi:hypothetical protein